MTEQKEDEGAICHEGVAVKVNGFGRGLNM